MFCNNDNNINKFYCYVEQWINVNDIFLNIEQTSNKSIKKNFIEHFRKYSI